MCKNVSASHNKPVKLTTIHNAEWLLEMRAHSFSVSLSVKVSPDSLVILTSTRSEWAYISRKKVGILYISYYITVRVAMDARAQHKRGDVAVNKDQRAHHTHTYIQKRSVHYRSAIFGIALSFPPCNTAQRCVCNYYIHVCWMDSGTSGRILI